MVWLDKEKVNEDLIDYAEQEAKVLAEFQIACADALERASNTLLNILLGGAGGGLALSISIYEKQAEDWLILGTFFTTLYLFGLCGLLIKGCLWSKFIYPLGNEPMNIYNDRTKNMNVSEVKMHNLENRKFCINENRKRNDAIGEWLNRIRKMSALTPLIIVISYLLPF